MSRKDGRHARTPTPARLDRNDAHPDARRRRKPDTRNSHHRGCTRGCGDRRHGVSRVPHRQPHQRNSVATSERGSATLQLVLVAPALLLAVSAVFQAMLYYHAVQVARLAATQGLVATQGLSGSTTAGRDRATAVLDQIGGVDQPTITAQR